MAMNLHLLRLFTAVAQHGSFSRAAAAVFVSQPAVSKAVQELERQVGAALVDRSRQGIALTAAGEALYRYAQQIFLTEQAAEIELARLRGVEQGRLTIGASPTIGTYLLPRLLAAYQQRYPDIRLFLDIGTTHEIATRLLQTPIDIAFVEGPVTDDRLTVIPWWEDDLVVIAPANHHLAQQTHVTLAQILAEPFIGREADSGTRAIIDDHLRARGIVLPVAMEVGSTEAIKQMVGVGLGLAMVSAATIRTEVAAGYLIVLAVPELAVSRRLLHLQVTERPISASAQAFLALLAAEEGYAASLAPHS